MLTANSSHEGDNLMPQRDERKNTKPALHCWWFANQPQGRLCQRIAPAPGLQTPMNDAHTTALQFTQRFQAAAELQGRAGDQT